MNTRTYIFGGVAGGTGKTAIALNLLACLGLAGKKNLLVDASPLNTLAAILQPPAVGAASRRRPTSCSEPNREKSPDNGDLARHLPFSCYSADGASLFPSNQPLPCAGLARALDSLARSRIRAASPYGQAVSERSPSQGAPQPLPDSLPVRGRGSEPCPEAHPSPDRSEISRSTEGAGAAADVSYILVDCATITDLLKLRESLPAAMTVLVVSPSPWEVRQLRQLLEKPGVPSDKQAAVKDELPRGALCGDQGCRVVVSKYDGSDASHKKIVTELRAALAGQVAKVQVPFDVSLGRAFAAGKSVVIADPSAPSAIACVRLARELFT